MKTETRERLFLPLMVPLGVLAVIVVLVGGFAAILLWNTREGAVALALAGAGGILFSISMLSSRDDLGTPRKAVAIVAGLMPLLVGAGLALADGGVGDPAALNINRQPHEVIPEDAPVIVTRNAVDFETQEVTMAAEAEVVLVFDNQDPGVAHNVWIVGLDGGEPDTADESFRGDIFAGVEKRAYRFTSPAAGTYAFLCTVHPNMEGAITFSEDSTEGLVDV
ncbi:MAG TPA: plastocyanin/azurin family copper-binding protein [Nitriliruptorales bacterium]